MGEWAMDVKKGVMDWEKGVMDWEEGSDGLRERGWMGSGR